ncbi:hypothetical protein RFI_21868 [Reticulomyxa filosa]|uniref:Uncharacterized protein n=1 Tax=Reticulomyxa filosa TaxID=46433 RepID=X6MPZ1_RETFI|nr:hypothetical protein RFI_21868 [Reticulomyxa filosa]|eukprot:ETO15497.1 hypothetical protein RFI_21868 [Reticulomyxa filosa]
MEKRSQGLIEYKTLIYEDDNDMAQKLLTTKCSAKMQEVHKDIMKHQYKQKEVHWSSLACAQMAFSYLASSHDSSSFQEIVYEGYIHNALEVSTELSQRQLSQVLQCFIAEQNLPLKIEPVQGDQKHTLKKTFLADLASYGVCPNTNKPGKMESKETEPVIEEKSATSSDSKQQKTRQPYVLLCCFERKSQRDSQEQWALISAVTTDMQYIHIVGTDSELFQSHWIATNDLTALINATYADTDVHRGYIKVQLLPNNEDSDDNSEYTYVRPASWMDALLLSRIQVEAWRNTYKDIITPKFLYGKHMTVSYKYEHWEEILDESKSQKFTWILCMRPFTLILGYATVGYSGTYTSKKILPEVYRQLETTGLQLYHCELHTLYLHPNAPKRKGLGQILFTHCFDFMAKYLPKKNNGNQSTSDVNTKQTQDITQKAGFIVAMSIWCLYDNAIGMGFYLKQGCQVISDHNRAHFGGCVYRYTGLCYCKQFKGPNKYKIKFFLGNPKNEFIFIKIDNTYFCLDICVRFFFLDAFIKHNKMTKIRTIGNQKALLQI